MAAPAYIRSCNRGGLGARQYHQNRKENEMLKRIAMLALLCISLVSAKNYTFTVYDVSQAGQTELKPGEYTLKVDGSKVVLIDNAGRRIDAPARIETADSKFEFTSVSTTKVDGANRIQSIQLGGTNNRVVFE
jgi:hypothetical protein